VDPSNPGAGRVQLEADFVLPDHFLPRSLATPERRLLLAVLEEAVGTYQRYVTAADRRGRVTYADVHEWFASDDDTSLFSFVGICEALGIEPAYMRTGVARWTARHGTAAPDAQALQRFPRRRVNGKRHRRLSRAQDSSPGA
jgi:hypothetical protein